NGWLHVVDNGRIAHPGPTEVVNAYHLAPRGVDKAAAVAADLQARGAAADEAVVIGDGPSEAAAAPHVRSVYIVANGADTLGERSSNVLLTGGARGAGFAEVVRELTR
ncbi:MAG TPA: HAD family phosphatase, partial [Actinomycetota bacterium]|nr:HAD family phosphatase [Actinomycetota bacterium]